MRHWFQLTVLGSEDTTARPALVDVYSTKPEIESLLSRRDRIAPYRLELRGSTRLMYADSTKGILQDPDVDIISGFATSSGLAAVALETAANIHQLLELDAFGQAPVDNTYFVGTVLSFSKAGYPAIGSDWIGALGWGGASFWLANPALKVGIGYVSDNPTLDKNEVQQLMARAINLALDRGDLGAFWLDNGQAVDAVR